MQVEIFTKPDCFWCERAKEFLASQSIPFYTWDVGPGRDAMKRTLLRLVPDATTVPQIFIDGEHVGGYEELIKLLGPDGTAGVLHTSID